MPVLAERQEKDLVEVVERCLGDHLLGNLLAVAADLGDFALVQLSHPAQRLGTLHEPASEVGEHGRRVGTHDDLDGVEDVAPDVVFDAIEVVEQDLPQSLGIDDLLLELTSQVEALDSVPVPQLSELLVLEVIED